MSASIGSSMMKKVPPLADAALAFSANFLRSGRHPPGSFQ
jgi:hypothetical protein